MRIGLEWIAMGGGMLLACASAWAQDARPRTRVSIDGAAWQINGKITYPGTPAQGLLMNVRMVNAVFEDRGPKAGSVLPRGFDPQANTAAFIRQIPDYVAHGVRAFVISLQGGMPGYEGAVNSAFERDGSLRDSYMQRVQAVIEACDAQGAVVILSCFYQRQNQALAGRAAIERAVDNVAGWVRQQGYANVVLEISNEYGHGGYKNWADGAWLSSTAGQVELIKRARRAAPGLLVSTSGMGAGRIGSDIAEAADFLLIHFNNTALKDYPDRIEAAKRYGKPVVCNEDDKIGADGARAAELSVRHGASWGLMHSRKNQYAPFEFDGAADDRAVYGMLRSLTTAGAPAAATDARAGSQAGAAGALSVLITTPNDGTNFPAGSNVTIEADVEGAASEVEFFANEQSIGRRSQAPWRLVWRRVPAGKYDLTARVTDVTGQAKTSSPVDIIVGQE